MFCIEGKGWLKKSFLPRIYSLRRKGNLLFLKKNKTFLDNNKRWLIELDWTVKVNASSQSVQFHVLSGELKSCHCFHAKLDSSARVDVHRSVSTMPRWAALTGALLVLCSGSLEVEFLSHREYDYSTEVCLKTEPGEEDCVSSCSLTSKLNIQTSINSEERIKKYAFKLR